MGKLSILVVVDAQIDFCTGSLANKEAQKTVPRIVDMIRASMKNGDTVVATMDTHEKDYLYTSEGRMLPVEHCIRGTEGHKFVPEISKALFEADVTVVHKKTFGSVDLPHVISNIIAKNGGFTKDAEKMTRIVLVGWCTDICVISNALILKAAFPEADIVVESSCCAGVTPEKHEAALEAMRSCQIRVI